MMMNSCELVIKMNPKGGKTYDRLLKKHFDRLEHVFLPQRLPRDWKLVHNGVHGPVLGLKSDLRGFALEEDCLASFWNDEETNGAAKGCEDKHDPDGPSPVKCVDEKAAGSDSNARSCIDCQYVQVYCRTTVGAGEEVDRHGREDGNNRTACCTGQEPADEYCWQVLSKRYGSLENDEEE